MLLRVTKMKRAFEKATYAQEALEAVKHQTQGKYEGTDYHLKIQFIQK